MTDDPSYLPSQVPDAPSLDHALISFFFPPLGLLAYMLLFGREPKRARSAGRGAILGIFVWLVSTAFTLAWFFDSTQRTGQRLNSELSSIALPTPATELFRSPDVNQSGSSIESPIAVPTARQVETVSDAEKVEVLERYRAWKLAWESQDIDALMGFYSSTVTVRDADGSPYGYDALRKRRLSRWKQEKTIEITDSEPTISVGSDTITLEFRRKYDSTTLHYQGVKIMDWQKTDGEWKIIEEIFDEQQG